MSKDKDVTPKTNYKNTCFSIFFLYEDIKNLIFLDEGVSFCKVLLFICMQVSNNNDFLVVLPDYSQHAHSLEVGKS